MKQTEFKLWKEKAVRRSLKLLAAVLLLGLFLAVPAGKAEAAEIPTSVKTLAVGKTYTIRGYTRVKSSRKSIAKSEKVKTEKYRVTAKKAGRSTLSLLDSKGNTVKKIYLLVTDDNSFQYDTEDLTLTVGFSETVKASVQTGCTVKYVSSKSSVASVDESGTITALKGGTATISARVYYKEKRVKTLKKSVTVDPVIQVLFVGNSKTFTGDIPEKVRRLASAGGKQVEVTQAVTAGETLSTVSTNKTSLIASIPYDYVVLQEHTDNYQKYAEFLSGAQTVVTAVQKKNPKVRVVVRKTWLLATSTEAKKATGYENARLVAANFGAGLTEEGPAFDLCESQEPSVRLLLDSRHPSEAGSYLSACCIYATLFGESPVGLSYTADLSSAEARKMQEIAAQASGLTQ